jgi:beta-phosphoglucomutase-like phosphatase (HAD superfamily)
VPDFDVVAAGDEVAAKKPAADVYLLALRRLGVPAEACVAVEDTENGLLSARGAGLRCLITTSLYGGRGPFPGAAAVVSDLGEPGTPAELLAGPTLAGGLVDLGWLAALPAASA